MVKRARRFTIHAVAALAVSAFLACRRPPENLANDRPFGLLDWPVNGATVGREVEFMGWALDDSRVAEVKLYVDGRYRTSATLKIPRPDVTKLYPRYGARGDVHGWWELIDLGEHGGEHTLRAEAVDDRGATGEIGSVTVKVLER